MRHAAPDHSDVPTIETDRLLLRGHLMDDFSRSNALWGNPEVTRYIGGKPLTTEECWFRFLRYFGHWSVLGFGYWVVEEKATKEFVGEVGFADYKREMHPPLGNAPELGWVLAPSKHGRGYATEAVKATLAWGRKYFGPVNAACLIHPDHRASIRVATKCGFKERHIAIYKGTPTIVFESQL